MIRDSNYWVREIQNYCNLEFLKAKEVWIIVSNYLINTKATSSLALRVVMNLDVPSLSTEDKEYLKFLLRK